MKRRKWRPINGRRIGGHHDLSRPGNRPLDRWVDTDGGPGPDIPNGGGFVAPAFPTGTLSGGFGDPVPDRTPAHVQADTLRMMLARHQPRDDITCLCGQQLGEETGLCWYGRQAQQRLHDLLGDEDDPDT
ncbi:hypothetical protein O7627_12745 [Solwaraspora sp. WMMD1047]|uniref:hypothetical protein n=1 Tax=Solwaraspora sp. WMMD1047 TaxID=3016102 RepID=UPI0024169F0C|nr:hypothetical protein [Solwaraspora sp. WMMD1047]MDG4830165.1 hypothetical protein [Solwaraspora sp. WMMD1047]